MATELIIKAWCDVCLEAGVNTPAETITVPALFGGPAYDVEVCDEHAAPLRAAIDGLRGQGRGVGKGVPRTPTNTPRTPSRAGYGQPSPGACPECGHAAPSLGAMRAHLRNNHDKSLADVGLVEAREKCPECGSAYPNKQGLAAHFRIAHPDVWREKTA